MPTLLVQWDLLDAQAWAQTDVLAHRAPGVGDADLYVDGDRACLVAAADTVEAVAPYLAAIGLGALVAAGTIGTPTVRLLEAVAVATLVDGALEVQRLWPRGKPRG